MKTLLVFSHLRWNFVFQRPQHLLSRLAGRFHVLFVEEPLDSEGDAFLEIASVAPNVDVLRPRTPLPTPGFSDEQLACVGPMVGAYLASRAIEDYLVWFYTPLPLPLLDDLRPRLVIYDCMDELSAFLGAPVELRSREAALLKRADLTLTGGPSLYGAKRRAGRNVLCLPSSVEADHFAPRGADKPAATGAADGRPRLGFFGVIDERMDLELISTLAAREPTWQIVMVGPIAKIDPTALPRAENLQWLGQRSYADLPALVAGWDVCLMPFAINEATRFISPTKTLEYLAAGKPVVSTAIQDVRTLYGDVVRVAAGREEFIAACREILEESAARRTSRQIAAATVVAGSSWDRTAAAISEAIDLALIAQTKVIGDHAVAAVAVAVAVAVATTGTSVSPRSR